MRYNDHFSSLGAGVLALYFLGAVVFSVIGLHPVLLGLSFLSALAYYACTAGPLRALKSLGAVLPFLLLFCIVNPLLNNRGATELMRVWGRSVTLEAVVYGLLSSLMLLCVLLWFGCMQQSLYIMRFNITIFRDRINDTTDSRHIDSKQFNLRNRRSRSVDNTGKSCS